jgi:hypothetical protein
VHELNRFLSVWRPTTQRRGQRLFDAPSPTESVEHYLEPESIFPGPLSNCLCSPKIRNDAMPLVSRVSRNSKRIIHRPPSIKAILEDVVVNSVFLRPIFSALSLPVMRNKATATSIACLLLSRFPAAVLGRLSSVVVDAANGILRTGTLPHVSKKLREGIPLLANSDSPSSVEVVAVAGWAIAPSPHGTPCSILGGFGQPVFLCRASASDGRISVSHARTFLSGLRVMRPGCNYQLPPGRHIIPLTAGDS